MWSWLSAPSSAGPINEIMMPKLGMNCSTPPRIAHNGAQGMPMISNPTSHRTATARESWHWAINQFFRAVPVMRAWERQSIVQVNHKGHEGSQRIFKLDLSLFTIGCAAEQQIKVWLRREAAVL